MLVVVVCLWRRFGCGKAYAFGGLKRVLNLGVRNFEEFCS